MRHGSGKAPMTVKRLKITCHGDSFKRALFQDSDKVVRPSTRPSQKTSNVASKDLFDFEWGIHYYESGQRLLVLVLDVVLWKGSSVHIR